MSLLKRSVEFRGTLIFAFMVKVDAEPTDAPYLNDHEKKSGVLVEKGYERKTIRCELR